jgi:hypothetical protein
VALVVARVMMRARERVALVARVTTRARKIVAVARVTKRARAVLLRGGDGIDIHNNYM